MCFFDILPLNISSHYKSHFALKRLNNNHFISFVNFKLNKVLRLPSFETATIIDCTQEAPGSAQKCCFNCAFLFLFSGIGVGEVKTTTFT